MKWFHLSITERDTKCCIETIRGLYKGYFSKTYLNLPGSFHSVNNFDQLFDVSYEDYENTPSNRYVIIGSRVGMEVSSGCCPECDDPQELIRRYYNLYKTNNISIE